MKKTLISIVALLLICSFCLTSCFNNPPDPSDPGDDGDDIIIDRPNDDPKPDDGGSTDPKPDPEPEDKQLRILFLGNSLMFFNDMPELFEQMAKKAGKNVYVDSITRGSATISDFAHATTDVGSQTYPKLQSERWDYVIIEPSRRITPYEQTTYNAELASAKLLQTMAAKAGAKLLLYCVWGNNDGTLTEYDATNPIAMVKGKVHYDYTRKMHVEFLKDVNTRFAQELGGVGVIDAGYAFENSMATYPNINLYDSDKRHPSLEGSYLAAACVYATIYNESPENIGFTGGTTLYFEMQRMARMTVIDKVVPNLEEVPEEIVQVDDPNTYDILFVGSDLIDSYDLVTSLSSMVSIGQNTKLNLTYVTNTTGVFNKLVDPSTDFGMRDAFARIKYDAVILQVSRRCTPSATDVEASELAALKAIHPVICENTDNVFLFTLNGSSNPAIFSTASDPVNYSKTDSKESKTAAQMNAYYNQLAQSWAEQINAKVILQGSAWTEVSPATDASKGYVRACSLYMSIFGEKIPEGVDTNGLDATVASSIEKIVAKHCLGEEEDVPSEIPTYDTYDVLVIGSKLLGNCEEAAPLASMLNIGQGKELHLQYVTHSVAVINKLAKKDSSDSFYSSYKEALLERKWDAIIVQISRRITPSATDVAASELEALKSIYGTISANCSNVYLITLIGTDNATVFSSADGAIEYTKTDKKETKSALEMSAFYSALANEWAQELGCKVIDQGAVRQEYTTSTDNQKGYMRACCYYNALFGEQIPAGSENNGLSADISNAITNAAAKIILNILPTDLTALNEAIALANEKDESQYTPNSWVAFAEALANAKKYNSDSEQEEVNLAAAALNEAMGKLVLRADFTALEKALATASSKVEANYTDATWADLVMMREEALALDANASQEQVNKAAALLNKAIENLTVKADLTALNEAIALAEGKNQDEYTIATWEELESALAVARALNENSPAEQVGNATVALNEAISKLVKKADLTALNAALASAAELNADDFVEAGWQELQNAIKASEGLTVESAQADVDAVAQRINDAIDALVPATKLPDPETYDILFIGSDLIEDEYIEPSLSSMISLGQGKELYLQYIVDGIGVINRLANHDETITTGNDVYLKFREALAERKWDAIIIQFSRRCTPGSAVVESEFNALKAIYPMLTANTDNIYLFTLNGASPATVFTTGGVAYTKTSETLTATGLEMSNFYKETVEAWCAELGCKTILYGSSYDDGFQPSTDKPKGFMRALCIYYSVFGEEMPSGTNVQGTSSGGVTKIKNAAAKYCLNK